MTSVEGLGDIRRAELDDNALLALGGIVLILEPYCLVVSVIGLVRPDERDNGLG